MTLDTPTNELVEKYVNVFNNDTRYYLADQAIINLFQKFPRNKKLEDILLKISVINDLYSTNIFGTYKMAEHILKLDIDKYLDIADPSIVNKIAEGHGIPKSKSSGDRKFYSFATKYCNWHKKDSYPIYDRFVDNILIAYRDKDKFSSFENNELKDYGRFREIIEDFRMHYNLTKHNLKEVDKFLWIYGKENFSSKTK